MVMAERLNMDQRELQNVINKTVMPANVPVSEEQYTAFLLVSNEHKLNPVKKEIYAFPTKRGGIQPMVSIDGWMRIINSHPEFDGMEFQDRLDNDGRLVSITCRMYRKDRQHAVEVTEYMAECRRGTDPWRQWPSRMLRHKAAIQCARYAFGFGGLYDQDELERMDEAGEEKVVTGSDTINGMVEDDKAEMDLAHQALEYASNIEELDSAVAMLKELPETGAKQEMRKLYMQRKVELQNASAQQSVVNR